ncbi:MAG: hypothetical protein EVA88_03400 [Rhodospirillaceae bacterium]|nr:MAG: hypothetical protein EVA88_03400 [Rhodospirillaceae bacterium]
MKFISAVLSAMAMAVALPVSTAQAQGYYSAPIFSAGGAVSLGVIGPRPHYSKSHAPTYYQQPQYVVRRTLKPIWALGQPVSLGNPTGNAEISIYSALSVSSEQSIPFAGTFDFGPSLGLGGRLAWNDPFSNIRVSSSMTATRWEIRSFYDGIEPTPYLAGSTYVDDYTSLSTDIGIGFYETNSWVNGVVGVNTDLDYNYALPYAGIEVGSQAEIAPGVALDFSIKGVREFSEASIRGFRTSGRWIATGTLGLRIAF